MAFYQRFSEYYDQIFPVQKQTSEMLLKFAGNDQARILDVACGTGGYAAVLAASGHEVFACDLDASMVSKAAARKVVKAFAADMTALTENEILAGTIGTFDLVYCIGNSIVHLPDENTISNAVRDFVTLLRPGGRLLIQIINYDRILDQKINHLPSLENANNDLLFERLYEISDNSGFLIFKTRLTNSKSENDKPIFDSETVLYPLRSEALMRAADNACLTGIRTYGSFAGADFDVKTSQPFILTGIRQN